MKVPHFIPNFLEASVAAQDSQFTCYYTFVQPLWSGSDSVCSTRRAEERTDFAGQFSRSRSIWMRGSVNFLPPPKRQGPNTTEQAGQSRASHWWKARIDRKLGPRARGNYFQVNWVIQKTKTGRDNEADECIRLFFLFSFIKWNESGLYRGPEQLFNAPVNVFFLFFLLRKKQPIYLVVARRGEYKAWKESPRF